MNTGDFEFFPPFGFVEPAQFATVLVIRRRDSSGKLLCSTEVRVAEVARDSGLIPREAVAAARSKFRDLDLIFEVV